MCTYDQAVDIVRKGIKEKGYIVLEDYATKPHTYKMLAFLVKFNRFKAKEVLNDNYGLCTKIY